MFFKNIFKKNNIFEKCEKERILTLKSNNNIINREKEYIKENEHMQKHTSETGKKNNICYINCNKKGEEIDILKRSYTFLKKIKQNRIKELYETRNRRNEIKYIIKIKSKNDNEKEIYNILKNKLELMTEQSAEEIDERRNRKNEKNIMRYKDYMTIYDKYVYIYEYIEGEKLFTYLDSEKLNNKKLNSIIFQLLKGLKTLHDNNIIHRDLKLENVMIKNDGTIKIIDYDMACVLKKKNIIERKNIGTVRYLSPESFLLGKYSKKSDVWNLGVLLYTLIAKKYPNNTELKKAESISNIKNIKDIYKELKLEYIKKIIEKNNIEKKIYNIIKDCLQVKEINRKSVDEILETYFKKN